ncbi:hypothetical protein RND71_014389 [Anisodus tanguticus]|uniref:Uncharacterized protein n=1 Tax=Anisodus tanguticus TaxID=243964 RepID=A0AAE1S906_9SOLA|nr:hypothetical protein RND71_014389 [Anisodus tanguticus]
MSKSIHLFALDRRSFNGILFRCLSHEEAQQPLKENFPHRDLASFIGSGEKIEEGVVVRSLSPLLSCPNQYPKSAEVDGSGDFDDVITSLSPSSTDFKPRMGQSLTNANAKLFLLESLICFGCRGWNSDFLTPRVFANLQLGLNDFEKSTQKRFVRISASRRLLGFSRRRRDSMVERRDAIVFAEAEIFLPLQRRDANAFAKAERFLSWQRRSANAFLQKPFGFCLSDAAALMISVAALPDAYQKHLDDATSAQCVMLSSMSMELQRQHENMGPNEMLEHLKSLYDSQSQTMEYELLIELFKCKLNEGGQVSQHVLKMIGLIGRLASIGTKLEKSVATTLILNSLPRSFENFIVNYNMNETKAGLPELHNMLKNFESSTSKGKVVLMVSSTSRPKPKGKE